MTSFYEPIQVCIATPCYGSQCFVEYVSSLISTINVFANNGVKLNIMFVVNESLVQRARNNLVARFLADPNNTHLMFIDADIGWNAQDIIEMLKLDKNIIGGLYPKKAIEYTRFADKSTLETLESLINNHATREEYIKELQPKLLNYVISSEKSVQTPFDIAERKLRGIQKVDYIGTGFMLIKREVIEKMIPHFAHTKNVNPQLSTEENKFNYALFECETRDNVYLSEDYLFCRRWIDLGGEIYAYLKANLTHVGLCRYNGNPLKILS